MDVVITGERLMRMYDNDCRLWYTPGGNVYWNTDKQWRDDYIVAYTHDLIEQACIDLGLDQDELRDNNKEITFSVDLNQ